MSLKTRILLQRGGRDQFGDAGDPTDYYKAGGLSSEEKQEFHSAVAAFFAQWWPAWQRFCAGKDSEQIWRALFRHGKPAYSTFETKRRKFVSLEEFLKFVLVEYRWEALMAMGHSHPASRKILNTYPALSRYVLEIQVGERKKPAAR